MDQFMVLVCFACVGSLPKALGADWPNKNAELWRHFVLKNILWLSQIRMSDNLVKLLHENENKNMRENDDSDDDFFVGNLEEKKVLKINDSTCKQL